MITSLVMLGAGLALGFTWGMMVTIKKIVVPLRKRHEKVLEEISTTIDNVMASVGIPVKHEDGSMVSPIQIRKL